MSNTGLLALEDGSVCVGRAFGARATVTGEAVFNTSLTGYQEILTDPSYTAQVVTMTTPQIGNYGVNPEDVENSRGPRVAGFVVRALSPVVSNWRATEDLSSYLARHGIPGVSGIDTRALTKKLRVTGAMRCCITTENITPEEAVARARGWSGMEGLDLVLSSTCEKPFRWDADGSLSQPFKVPGTDLNRVPSGRKQYRVVAYDFGAKLNIWRKLRLHGFDVHVVPATTPAEAVKEMKPDAVFLSNGPGDPAAVTYAHKAAQALIPHYPTFGICLGHQILTHALGAKTFKLKFGHRGGNQPVKNLETGVVSITSQNHGFASTRDELERVGAVVTEINLNDGTVEGLRHRELPVFSVQYHPEAAPGPHDSDPLFEQFYQMTAKARG